MKELLNLNIEQTAGFASAIGRRNPAAPELDSDADSDDERDKERRKARKVRRRERDLRKKNQEEDKLRSRSDEKIYLEFMDWMIFIL